MGKLQEESGRKKRTRKTLRPLFDVVLIRHDKDLDKTEGGILLPDNAKIPTLTGVIAAVSEKMRDNRHDFPFQEGDKVVYDTRERVPYDLDPRNNYYLVNVEHLLAVVEEEEIEDDEEEAQRDAD